MDDNLITPSDFFHRGLERLEAGRFSEAVSYFEQAVERDYFDPDIYMPMAEALFEVGRFSDCQKWLKKAQEAGAISPEETLMWRGSCFLEQHKIRRAMSAFNRVLETSPDHAEAHFKRGLALTEIGSPDRALEAFQEAERLLRAMGDVDSEALAEVLMWKGRALTRLGRRAEGLQRMFEAFEIAPDHPGPYNEIADSFRFSGDLASAEEWYRKGLERLPEDPSLHNDYGNLLRETGRYRDSLEHLSTAIDRDANRAVAYYNRALTLERLELFDEALKDYDTVIESNPTDLDAKLRKLDLMTQMGLFTDAGALLEELTESERATNEVKEATARMHNRRAVQAEVEGDLKTTLQCHRAALALHPDFLDVESPAPGDDRAEQRLKRLVKLLEKAPGGKDAALAQLLLAAANYTFWRLQRLGGMPGGETGEIDRIESGLKKALKLGAFPAQAHRLLAEFCFYELENDERAIEHADAALEECDDFIGALWIKAAALADGRLRPDLAVECYRRMLEITPNNSGVLLKLGDLYLDHGQAHRALAYYRRVLEDRPGDVSVNRDIAHCYLALERYGEAIACFSRLQAQGVMELEIKLDLAEAHLAVGERVEAGQYISEAMGENAGLDPRIDARAIELNAALMLARRNPKGAIKEMGKLGEMLVSTIGILQLARAEILLENFDKAWAHLEEITATLDPHARDAVEARYHQARILFSRGKQQEALKKLDEMLASAPLDERAYRLKAWIHMLEGDLEKADHTEEEKKFALQVSRVHRLLQFEDFAEALGNADALVEDYPGRAEPRYYRACALAQLGEDEPALDELRALVEKAPDIKPRLLEEFYLEPLRLNDRIEFREQQ